MYPKSNQNSSFKLPLKPPRKIPPPHLSPDAFLRRSTLSKDAGKHSSTATLHDEMDTLSLVKAKLAPPKKPTKEKKLVAVDSATMLGKWEDAHSHIVSEFAFRPRNRTPSPEPCEISKAFAYQLGGDKYKPTRASALRSEWIASNRAGEDVARSYSGRQAKKGVVLAGSRIKSVSASDSNLKAMGFGSNVSLRAETPPDSTASLECSQDAAPAEDTDEDSPAIQTNEENATTPDSQPASDPVEVPNDQERMPLSVSALLEAPSLTSLSTLRAEHAKTPKLRFVATCKGCNIQIPRSETTLSAVGFTWHPKCFTCANAQCGKPIGKESFYQRGKFSYCESCWIGDCCPKCDECGLPIEDRKEQTLVQGHAYHKSCFICSHCEKPLLPMSQFVEPDGVRFCLPCYTDVHGKRCMGCGDLCTIDFVSVNGGNTYHKVCITCSVCFQSLEECDAFYQSKNKFYCNEHRINEGHG
ncbi:Four and a half LIM domains protein 3 [Chytriomyces hyalinus]|nr:Four and a half LIM domains protein 3 [Chytriomyces hyalinus]